MNLSTLSGAVLSVALASAAAAPAAAQPSERNALPSYASREETVHGRIAAVVDTYHIRSTT
jgi:opacity protein-like surface antigen